METYLVRDYSTSERLVIGRMVLEPEVNPGRVAHLATNGYLNLSLEKSPEKAAAIREEQEKNEAEAEDPEGSLERTQAAIEAEARALPEGDYVLEDLKIKQLYAICEERGLKSYGTKADCIQRIRTHEKEVLEAQAAAAEGSGDPSEVNLDELSKAELQEIAGRMELSTSGTKAELIERIYAVGEKPEGVE